ncbi:MAG: LPXTG cell wall anchor domain-containing protein [Blautia sp.]
MAAIVALSSAPVYTYAAAEDDNVMETGQEEETENVINGTEDSGEGQDTGKTAQEVTPTPTVVETPEATPTQTVAPTQTPTPTPTAEPGQGQSYSFEAGSRESFETQLSEAVKQGYTEITVKITGTISVDRSLSVSGLGEKKLTIVRGDGFTGAMFKTTSEKATLTMEGAITVDGTLDKGKAKDPMFEVVKGSSLTMTGVTLKGTTMDTDASNKEKGSAIYSKGTVNLSSVTVTKNSAEAGAVYLSGTENTLSGKMNISGNKNSKDENCNLYLAKGASFRVKEAWEKDSKVGVTAEAKDDSVTIYEYTGKNSIKEYLESDDKSSYQVVEEGTKGRLDKISTPTPPDKKDYYDATKHMDENDITGLKDSYTKGSKATFTVVGAGLDREPKAGDTAYVPTQCRVKSSGGKYYKVDDLTINANGDYIGTMTMNASEGTYTLIASYELREWSDGIDSWEDAVPVNSGSEVESETTVSKEFKVVATTTNTKKNPTTTTKKTTATPTTTKAKNAKTADESPILPLAGLCAASALAGGLVITRKRKREN